MAVSTNSYFNNAIQGMPQVGADVEIYEENSTPKYTVGHCIERSDGSRYRYSHFGIAMDAGLLVSQDFSESSTTINYLTVIASASAQTTTDGATDSYYIEVKKDGITADQFAGGYLTVAANQGKGFTYRIKGNTATGNPASGNFRIELYSKIKVYLDATSDIIITGSKFANLESTNLSGAQAIHSDNVIAGVTVASITTAGYYGWVQTRGLGSVKTAALINRGEMVVPSQAIKGQVETGGDYTSRQPLVGVVVGSCAASGFAIVDLRVE